MLCSAFLIFQGYGDVLSSAFPFFQRYGNVLRSAFSLFHRLESETSMTADTVSDEHFFNYLGFVTRVIPCNVSGWVAAKGSHPRGSV